MSEPAAGRAGIVVQISGALPHSLGCFLAALAGNETGNRPTTLLPHGTDSEIPGGALPVPGVPLAGPAPRISDWGVSLSRKRALDRRGPF